MQGWGELATLIAAFGVVIIFGVVFFVYRQRSKI